uniref:hypothetical protein n=1 Tax=Streptomyces sp. DG1A-41 TaxID=3125779 RepID=UPI0040400709
MPPFLPGLELSHRFCTEAVRPLLDEALPGVPRSAARPGSGLEVLGYDTPRSADHERGPRLQLFLRPEDAEARGPARFTSQLGFDPAQGVTTADWLATPPNAWPKPPRTHSSTTDWTGSPQPAPVLRRYPHQLSDPWTSALFPTPGRSTSRWTAPMPSATSGTQKSPGQRRSDLGG